MIDENIWETVAVQGEIPSARFGHTTVKYKDQMLIFGGVLASGEDKNVYSISLGTIFCVQVL